MENFEYLFQEREIIQIVMVMDDNNMCPSHITSHKGCVDSCFKCWLDFFERRRKK